jgi:hypothetical protein
MDEDIAEAVEAAHGSSMLETKVRFFTNELAPPGRFSLERDGRGASSG